LEFVSGFAVEGKLKSSYHRDGKLLTLTFNDCTVSRGGTRYFQPEWGEFDLAVGGKVVAAFGGPADVEAFGELNMGQASSSPHALRPSQRRTLVVFALRETSRHPAETQSSEQDLEAIAAAVLKQHSSEWLLEIELLEIATQKLKATKPPWAGQLESMLAKNKKNLPEPTEHLIEKGLQY
jgi:phenylalanine-4-hydroxylase